MSDGINRHETSHKNENDADIEGLPESYVGDVVVSKSPVRGTPSEEEKICNVSRSFSVATEIPNNQIVANDDEHGHFASFNQLVDYSRPAINYYDFQQNSSAALPMVVMPATMTIARPPAEESMSEAERYYALNDVNVYPWHGNLIQYEPSSDCFADGSGVGVGGGGAGGGGGGQIGMDYFYPIFYRTGNEPSTMINHLQDRYAIPPNATNLALGYDSPYPYVVPYTHYTTLQPQNFYASMRQPVVCKPKCTPTTRVPTTRCTQKPGQKVPPIAWENNNTCCCELYGPPYGGVRMGPIGRGRLYGPCKPPPLPMTSQREALYCHGRRRKREYYLQAPKARVRVQKETDRCRITTTTTPRPHPWPTNYPIKFRLQKSLDASGLSKNQVNNLHTSPTREHDDKIVVYENQAKSQRSRGRISKETASSQLRKKHNEVKMQELQESLEIALEKMNQEMMND